MADEEVTQYPWQVEAKPQQYPWEAAKQETDQNLTRSAREAINNAARSLGGKVQGKNEYDYPEITHAMMHGGELNELVADELNNQLGESSGGKAMEFLSLLKRARGEKGMIDILGRFDPEMTTGKDKFGNTIVKFAGKPYYINRAGLSERDLDEGFRDALLTIPFSGAARAVTPAAGPIVRSLGQAVAGAAGSVTSDIVSRGAGSEQPIDTGAMLTSALGGAGGEALGSALGWAINRVAHNPARYFNAK